MQPIQSYIRSRKEHKRLPDVAAMSESKNYGSISNIKLHTQKAAHLFGVLHSFIL
jgi:hypothetical protein